MLLWKKNKKKVSCGFCKAKTLLYVSTENQESLNTHNEQTIKGSKLFSYIMLYIVTGVFHY